MTIDSVGSSNTSGYSFTGGADVNPTYISSTSITPYTGMVGGGKQKNRFGRRLAKKLRLMGKQRTRSVKRSIKKVKRKRRLKKGMKRRTIRQDIIKSIERGEPISIEKSKKLTPSMQKFLQGIETSKSAPTIKFSDFKENPVNKKKYKKKKKKKKRTTRKAMTGGMSPGAVAGIVAVATVVAGAVGLVYKEGLLPHTALYEKRIAEQAAQEATANDKLTAPLILPAGAEDEEVTHTFPVDPEDPGDKDKKNKIRDIVFSEKGKLGLNYVNGTSIVEEIKEGGAAEKLNVKVGWTLTKVNGEDVAWGATQAYNFTGLPMTLTFREGEPL